MNISALLLSAVCMCGEAPERAYDFFWENDRIGFRAYGPGDSHKWSGIDVFNKNCQTNLVAMFLSKAGHAINWHKNYNGQGMDDYAVGPGRGVGGIARRKNGEWMADHGDWVRQKVLFISNERCVFELTYKLPEGGEMTLAIELKQGSPFFREAVYFSKDADLEGVEVGAGLDLNAAREHVGDLQVDAEKGIVSLFEKPHNRPGEDGSMMNAVFAAPGQELTMADEPNGAKMLMTRPLSNAGNDGTPVLVVYAGADWTEAGYNRTAAEWHKAVRDFRKELERPAFRGPLTSVREFLGTHLDTSIPALSGIPGRLKAGDLAGAERIFADYLRSTLSLERIKPNWKRGATPGPHVRSIAEDVMNYKLSAVGYHHQFRPHAVDWIINPTIGFYQEWPWQLSRHQDLTLLAEYYAMTGDERAAKVWVEIMESWLDQAVFPTDGPTDASRACWRTLDGAIRIPRWTRQIAAFKDSPNVSDHFLTRLGASLYEHGKRLRVSASSGGNWLIHELNGLMRLVLFHRYFKDTAAWRAYCEKTLLEQYTGQVYKDGFHVETTTDYHTDVLDGYLEVADAYEMAGETAPEYIRSDLKKSFDVFVRLARPDGRTPGLNDGGNASVKHWCAKGLTVYPDVPYFKWFATEGREGTPPSFLSDAFEYAGYVTFRNGWDANAVWGFFDAGSEFWRGWHSHEDALNFLLSAYGKKMIDEPGNYRYDTSEMRKYVITTPSHNTIMIDGCGQCRKDLGRAKDFSMDRKSDFSFRVTADADFASCAYADGYDRGRIRDVRHRRTVMFVKRHEKLKPFFAIIDRLTSTDTHDFDVLWHLEKSKLAITGNRFTADFGDGVSLTGVTSSPEAFVDMKGSRNPLQGWMPIWDESKEHEHRPIPTPVLHGSFIGSRSFVTVFQPNEKGEESPIVAVESDRDSKGISFTLVLKDGSKVEFN